MFTSYLLSLLCALLLTLKCSAVSECNRDLWDDALQGRGVKRVDVHCDKGHITWHGPYGGLFIQIRGPQSEYELCIQAYTIHTSAVVMAVRDNSMDKLMQLNETENAKQGPKSTVCFPHSGELLLFVEPSIGAPVSSEIVLDYDIDKFPRYGQDECRPCTDEELLWHSCTSDFVVIAQMLAVQQNVADTIIPVSVDKLKRQSLKYFSRTTNTHGRWKGALYAPAKCGMKYGKGQFVFMGRLKFGKAMLRCAPTVEDYFELQRTSKLKGTLLCT